MREIENWIKKWSELWRRVIRKIVVAGQHKSDNAKEIKQQGY